MLTKMVVEYGFRVRRKGRSLLSRVAGVFTGPQREEEPVGLPYIPPELVPQSVPVQVAQVEENETMQDIEMGSETEAELAEEGLMVGEDSDSE